LVKYCSECDDTPVEVWRVLRVLSEPGPKNYSSTLVVAERVFVSEVRHGKGHYHEPVNFRRISTSEPPHERIVSESVDLASVYSSAGTNRFQCLGKRLALDCEVDVAEIVLPEDVFKSVAAYIGPEEDYRGNKFLPTYDITGAIIKIAEPDGAANGSQPIRPETNRTSSAAGSRR
jgi:hypothetical protein